MLWNSQVRCGLNESRVLQLKLGIKYFQSIYLKFKDIAKANSTQSKSCCDGSEPSFYWGHPNVCSKIRPWHRWFPYCTSPYGVIVIMRLLKLRNWKNWTNSDCFGLSCRGRLKKSHRKIVPALREDKKRGQTRTKNEYKKHGHKMKVRIYPAMGLRKSARLPKIASCRILRILDSVAVT